MSGLHPGWVNSLLPSLKRTASLPLKMVAGRQAFPFGMAYFQGRTVSFAEIFFEGDLLT